MAQECVLYLAEALMSDDDEIDFSLSLDFQGRFGDGMPVDPGMR